MAGRSARARSKLDKITGSGVTKTFGGLTTPSNSTGSQSVSSLSSRSFGRSSSHHKSVFRSFLDTHSDRIRGSLEEKIRPVANIRPRLDAAEERGTQFRRWEGGGRGSQPWDKLRRDPELWFPDGDTLVYLSEKDSKSKEDQAFKHPCFKIRSSTLRDTNSPLLVASLFDYDDLPTSPTPSLSSTMSFDASTSSLNVHDTEGIVHELHFPAPRITDKSALYRHHITTRNFFAYLFNRPIVGLTLGQTLIDLVARMDLYMPGVDNVAAILKYLQKREFDDVRNSPDMAAGMLQFAEKFELRDLWRECFVHCVGMMAKLELSPEYVHISPITRALIDRANLEIQVRVGKADRLLGSGGFVFPDFWPHSFNPPPARLGYEKFQKFLIKHYQNRFGSWPPPGEKFSRMLYCQLQQDFASLYDYLVDRDVVWETTGQQPKQSLRLVNPHKPSFTPNDMTLAFTDIIVNFDTAHQYPHIPHPYPLVPERTGSASAAGHHNKAKQGPNFFGTNKKATQDRVFNDKAVALALMDATNVDALYATSHVNSLVEAYSRMEKSEHSDIDPHDLRKGRWLLVYAILQTLATVSVDAPGLKWTDGVDYYLCAQLRGTPPWDQNATITRDGQDADDIYQYRSHCWTQPQMWSAQASEKMISTRPLDADLLRRDSDNNSASIGHEELRAVASMHSLGSIGTGTTYSETQSHSHYQQQQHRQQQLRHERSPYGQSHHHHHMSAPQQVRYPEYYHQPETALLDGDTPIGPGILEDEEYPGSPVGLLDQDGGNSPIGPGILDGGNSPIGRGILDGGNSPIGPGILEQDDFVPSAFEQLSTLGMDNTGDQVFYREESGSSCSDDGVEEEMEVDEVHHQFKRTMPQVSRHAQHDSGVFSSTSSMINPRFSELSRYSHISGLSHTSNVSHVSGLSHISGLSSLSNMSRRSQVNWQQQQQAAREAKVHGQYGQTQQHQGSQAGEPHPGQRKFSL